MSKFQRRLAEKMNQKTMVVAIEEWDSLQTELGKVERLNDFLSEVLYNEGFDAEAIIRDEFEPELIISRQEMIDSMKSELDTKEKENQQLREDMLKLIGRLPDATVALLRGTKEYVRIFNPKK